MLEDGISYPLKGDSALGRIFVGGLLGIFGILIVPSIILMGYLLRVLEGSARGAAEPPAFEDWGGLLSDGLKGFVVTIAYGILPFLLVAFSVGFGSLGAASGSDAAAGIMGGVGLLGALVSLVAMFVLYYLIPAALTNMALEGSVGAAFDFGTLKRVLLSVDYLVAWVVPFLIGFVANIVTTVLVIFTLGLGLLVVPFIQFYVQVSIFYMFGRAFGSVTDLDGRRDAVDAPSEPAA